MLGRALLFGIPDQSGLLDMFVQSPVGCVTVKNFFVAFSFKKHSSILNNLQECKWKEVDVESFKRNGC